MILKEVADIDDIKSILCDPEIYDTITDDSASAFIVDETILNSGCTFVGGYIEGKIIALACYHKYKDGNKYHPCVLPDFRNKYANEFVEQSLKLKGTQSLYVEIPKMYPHVIKFAKKHGFQLVYSIKKSHIKNGTSVDVDVMRFKKWD